MKYAFLYLVVLCANDVSIRVGVVRTRDGFIADAAELAVFLEKKYFIHKSLDYEHDCIHYFVLFFSCAIARQERIE